MSKKSAGAQRAVRMFRLRVIALMKEVGEYSGSPPPNGVLSSWIGQKYPAPDGLDKYERFAFWISKIDGNHILSGKLVKKKPAKQSPKPEKKIPVGIAFYETREWREIRYKALLMNNGKCELCGAGKHDGIRLHVDHIKPRSKFPELSLTLSNLQVLCEDCNIGKSNKDDTDWRA